MRSVVVLAIALYLSMASVLPAQWRQTQGPLNKWTIRALAASGNTIYATADSTWGGTYVYCSTDNGLTWNQGGVVPGMQSHLMVAGNYLYAGTNNGVFQSADNGQHWTKTLDGEVWSFASLGSDVFATVLEKGIYRSTDNGSTWTPLEKYLWRKVVACGSDLFALSDYDTLARSTDHGSHWTYFNYRVGTIESVGSTLYSDINGPVYSTNFGTSWSPVPIGGMGPFAARENRIYIYTWYGLYHSTNSGATWDSTVFGNLPWYPSGEMAVTDSKVFVGTYSGLYSSSDNGSNWEPVDVAFHLADCFAIVAFSGNIFAGTEQGVFRSRDVGGTWEPVNKGFRRLGVYALVGSGTTLFAGTSTGAYRSTDFGDSWDSVHQHGIVSQYRYIQKLAVQGSDVYASTDDNGLFRSTDNGDHWTFVGPSKKGIWDIAVSANDLYVSTGSTLFHSADNGGRWDSLRISGEYATSLSAVRDLLFYNTSNGFYRSSDRGATSGLLSDFPYRYWPRRVISNENSLFAAAWDLGFWRSEDNGMTWTPDNTGFSSHDSAKALAVTGDNVYAGTNSGVWHRQLNQLMAVTQQSAEDVLRVSSQPNPFTSRVTFSFDLPEAAFVSMKIFDALGNEIAQLASGILDAGPNMRIFDATRLPEGIYYYRLQVGDQDKAGKIVLLR